MLRQVAYGVARLLFAMGMLTAGATVGLLYLAYRTLRFATVGSKPQPVREAAFATLLAGVGLVKALQAARPDLEAGGLLVPPTVEDLERIARERAAPWAPGAEGEV